MLTCISQNGREMQRSMLYDYSVIMHKALY